MKDTSECIIVFGPVTVFNPSQSASIVAMGSALGMLYLLRYRQIVAGNALFSQEEEVIQRADYEKTSYTGKNIENKIERLSYEYERAYLEQIKNGDVEGIKNRGNIQGAEKMIGRMAKKPLKQFEYMICTAISLATRAAIDGGLDPNSAYALSDLYLQRLENCKDVEGMFALSRERSLNFAKQVNLVKQKRSALMPLQICLNFQANLYPR